MAVPRLISSPAGASVLRKVRRVRRVSRAATLDADDAGGEVERAIGEAERRVLAVRVLLPGRQLGLAAGEHLGESTHTTTIRAPDPTCPPDEH